MRRWLMAVLVALAMVLTACSGDDENPEETPEPEAPSTSPPEGVPPADSAAEAVAAGIAAADLVIDDVTHSDAAQSDLTDLLARMRGQRPDVELDHIIYGPRDNEATAHLTYVWQLDVSTWEYTAELPLEFDDERWRARWQPSAVHPQLTADTRLQLTRQLPRREAINDSAGLALVEQLTMYQVGLDKSVVAEDDWPAVAEQIATLMDVDVEAYQERVMAGGERQFVVARTVTRDAIPPEIADIPGAHVGETERMVPFSPTFAIGVLGTSSEATAEMIEQSEGLVWQGDLVGRSALQARYNDQLRGVPEMRVELVARPAEEGSSAPAVEPSTLFMQDASVGTPVNTSLDRELQERAEEVLAEQEGLASLVVIRPSDGALLVAANSPAAGEYPQATFGKFAPGSTFKVVSSLAMLREGLTPTSRVQCPASIEVSGQRIGNYSGYPSGYTGSITLTDALAQSCNTAFALAGADVSPDDVIHAAGSLGVGMDYDVGFSANFGHVEPLNNAIDRAATMYGQGQVSMSPLAMATVAASVAKGETVIPWLVEGQEQASKAVALTAQEAGQLQEMMQATVSSGSGQVLQGVMEGAKTGTAEFGQAGEYQTHAWMIAWNADYAVAAFVEVGSSGSGDAAPLIIDLFS